MLRQFTRLPLRRCLHTSAARTAPLARPTRAHVALGVSAVAVVYLTWRTAAPGQTVALDAAATATKKHPLTASDAVAPDTVSSAVNEHASHTTGATLETDTESAEAVAEAVAAAEADADADVSEGGASGGAYNPETGEINWDCPCLGGMAHGPCGPQFREAFSCFIFSEKEPKGIDCVEKFKGMQDCFREHPEVYAEEIMDDDEDEEGPPSEPASGPTDFEESSPAPPSDTAPTLA